MAAAEVQADPVVLEQAKAEAELVQPLDKTARAGVPLLPRRLKKALVDLAVGAQGSSWARILRWSSKE